MDKQNNQLHKRMDNDPAKFILEKYVDGQLSVQQALDKLEIKKTRFFELVKEFKSNPVAFSVGYQRKRRKRLDEKLEQIILTELKKDTALIHNNDIPIHNFNFTYLKDQIFEKHHLKVSVPTIIKRAKEYNLYIPRKEIKKHDREVITNYPGQLIQHDSSHHKFSPGADKKWYLITSLDDYSRYILYAKLIEQETSWEHILALESVILRFGIPYSYYTDSHSIFRFVQGRDSVWRNHRKLTDQVNPQWKQILEDLHIKLIYALSPQAKGKIERPYRWIQERMVRTCARENIKTIQEAQQVLENEVYRYNNRQVHSTTKEIPVIRLDNALKNKKTLFRECKVPAPYETIHDIFCFRVIKTVDAYHKIKINNMEFRVKNVPLREKVEIRVVPDRKGGVSELRFWYRGKLVDIQKLKTDDIH